MANLEKLLKELLPKLAQSESSPKPKPSPPSSSKEPEFAEILELLRSLAGQLQGGKQLSPKALKKEESWLDWGLSAAEKIVPKLLEFAPMLLALL